jgi:hypothetical protein
MIIHEPEITVENGEALLSARVETTNSAVDLPKTLWFAYPLKFQGDLSLRADAFLTALLLIAQTLGEDLHLKGEVSPRLLYGANEYQQIFHYWDPSKYQRIQITTDRITPAPPPRLKDQYVSLFSGGVDSFFTLYQGLYPQEGFPTYPLTHGLFMHGSADIPLAYEEKYQIIAQRFSRLYADLGLELITARSNIMQFSAHRIPFVSFLEAPTVSCAMGLSPLLSGVLTPSGQTYKRYRLNTTGPLTPQILCTETFEAKSAGGAYTRLQKVDTVSKWEVVQKNLRVCFSFVSKTSINNCSRCSKCMRTRMDLHLLGRLKDIETLERSFGLLDYLRWGRWLETSHGWEKNAWNYSRKHRPDLLPGVALGLLIGYIRVALKRVLPARILQWIFKYTAIDDPHIMHQAGGHQVPTPAEEQVS